MTETLDLSPDSTVIDVFVHHLPDLLDREKRGIRQLLVKQKAENRFKVQLVPGTEGVLDCIQSFERRMREHLGDSIEVEFELVAEITGAGAGGPG